MRKICHKSRRLGLQIRQIKRSYRIRCNSLIPATETHHIQCKRASPLIYGPVRLRLVCSLADNSRYDMIQDSSVDAGRIERFGIQFITYDDKQNGRSHDSKTRRLVRKQARIASQHTQNSQLKSPLNTRSFSTKAPPLKDYQSRFRLHKGFQIPHQSTTNNPIDSYISPLRIRDLDHDASILLGYCKINLRILYWT